MVASDAVAVRVVDWQHGRVRLLDTRQLPWNAVHLEYSDYREVAAAISEGVVSGGPAVGIAAAYGMALAGAQSAALDMGGLLEFIDVAALIMGKAAPGSAALRHALHLMRLTAHDEGHANAATIREALRQRATALAVAAQADCAQVAAHAAALIRDGDTVLLHAGGGAPGASEFAVPLGALQRASEGRRRVRALISETRPRLEGARLAAWELHQLGIPFQVIADSAAGWLMRRGEVRLVLAMAERVAANGDCAARIGTYSMAALAQQANVPFYLCAPSVSVDLAANSGDDLALDERSGAEMRQAEGGAHLPEEYAVGNPSLDVTPQRYLAGIITAHGVVNAPFRETLIRALNGTAP